MQNIDGVDYRRRINRCRLLFASLLLLSIELLRRKFSFQISLKACRGFFVIFEQKKCFYYFFMVIIDIARKCSH